MICLGSRVNKGTKEFTKVDLDYVMEAGKMAKKHEVPDVMLISSVGASSKSWFTYMKVKGQAEEGLKQLDLPRLTIL